MSGAPGVEDHNTIHIHLPFHILDKVSDMSANGKNNLNIDASCLTNEQMRNHSFLSEMSDEYYPISVVDKGKAILIRLCHAIEMRRPQDLTELYTLSHAATEEFNELQSEFEENGSEIETIAREAIADDFFRIASAYGFKDVDIETMIAPRDW